ncbi:MULTISPECIES: hypothetical protein [Halomonadaceae]|mgnify:CR=1 FL=1|jgi:hypothetical protein|uniref:Uncharacterized protein n=1 Tax=Vreelandella subterranea TaxID=416874 RepID=A0A1H9T4V7_9GAMM|nr:MULTISPECIES: hypothetical protein [Halomonas]MCW4148789.1 hypothetical protein [Halomonas sp. 18H]MCZ0930498.1 hypothetical protein [Halomonas janggokensis]MDR5884695.1 hypothetical protein [Halomonas janggokensis]QPL45274.1 hypothetical protein IT895_13905 [Halomonas sp. A40-4]SER92198.1 hypothetical protein SAMN04487958_104190 [Halomonas subterranea]
MSISNVFSTRDSEVLNFWTQRAYWQRAASDALADYCESLTYSLPR